MLRSGVIAKKVGMTRLFMEDGKQIPVTVLQLQHGDGDLLAVFHEETGHADLFSDDTGTEHQLDPP